MEPACDGATTAGGAAWLVIPKVRELIEPRPGGYPWPPKDLGSGSTVGAAAAGDLLRPLQLPRRVAAGVHVEHDDAQ
jgi:hypothetical protein